MTNTVTSHVFTGLDICFDFLYKNYFKINFSYQISYILCYYTRTLHKTNIVNESPTRKKCVFLIWKNDVFYE